MWSSTFLDKINWHQEAVMGCCSLDPSCPSSLVPATSHSLAAFTPRAGRRPRNHFHGGGNCWEGQMSTFLLSVQEAWRASMGAVSVLLHKGILGQHSYWGEGDMAQAHQHSLFGFASPTEECLFLLLWLLSWKIGNVLTDRTMLCTISVPPPSSSRLFGRKLLEEGGSSITGEAEESREVRQNGHCVAGAVIAEGLRECRGIVNESDEKLLF